MVQALCTCVPMLCAAFKKKENVSAKGRPSWTRVSGLYSLGLALQPLHNDPVGAKDENFPAAL